MIPRRQAARVPMPVPRTKAMRVDMPTSPIVHGSAVAITLVTVDG
jgi:hypothetical protein